MRIVTKKLLFTFSLIITIFSYNKNVSAKQAICSVSITAPVNFGTIDPYDSTPETTLGEAKVTCTNIKEKEDDITYTLSFAVTGKGSRVIKNGTNSLSYNIYNDKAYTQILGDGSNGTILISKTYKNVSSDFTDTYTIYANIPVQPAAINGDYSDSLLVTLQY